jgi:hypothetical protein
MLILIRNFAIHILISIDELASDNWTDKQVLSNWVDKEVPDIWVNELVSLMRE